VRKEVDFLSQLRIYDKQFSVEQVKPPKYLEMQAAIAPKKS
jgi:hypothetical protein